MALTLAKIEEMAPDQGSLDAARKLLKPQGWPTIAADGEGLVWGECQGSGASPYRVVFSESDLGYKCTCPSRKFPCKHTLALMWMRADGRPFAAAPPPAWVADWLSRRRGPAAPRAEATPRAPVSLEAAAAPEAAPDPKAEARAAAQRERNRAEREEMVLEGLDALDRWILDQLERGLAGFATIAQEQCRLLARRLVDAKAGGLAARIELLPAALFGLPEGERGTFLIERLGALHLIAEAYRRQSVLPEALRADVRQAVGWSLSREALLADPQAPRVRDRWMVLATVDEVQPDKLRRLETWLARLGEGEGPRFAVLIDFVPVSLGAVGSSFSAGERFEAELVFHPSAAPLRAVVGAQAGGAADEGRWPRPADDLAAALGRHAAALAARPWLEAWPMAMRGVTVGRASEGLALAGEDAALPIRPTPEDGAWPLVGIGPIDAFGIWDGRRLDLLYAETALGRWVAP